VHHEFTGAAQKLAGCRCAPKPPYERNAAQSLLQAPARQRGVEDGAPPPARQPAGRGDTRPNRQTERL